MSHQYSEFCAARLTEIAGVEEEIEVTDTNSAPAHPSWTVTADPPTDVELVDLLVGHTISWALARANAPKQFHSNQMARYREELLCRMDHAYEAVAVESSSLLARTLVGAICTLMGMVATWALFCH